MKNIHDVLRQKELEIGRLKKEIEALRLVAPLLEDKEPARRIAPSPASRTSSSTQQDADSDTAERVFRAVSRARLRDVLEVATGRTR